MNFLSGGRTPRLPRSMLIMYYPTVIIANYCRPPGCVYTCTRRDDASAAMAMQIIRRRCNLQSHVQYVARNEKLVDRVELKEKTRSRINYIQVCLDDQRCKDMTPFNGRLRRLTDDRKKRHILILYLRKSSN